MSDSYLSGLGKRLGTRGALAIGIPLALLVVGGGLYFYGSRSRAENLDSVYGKRSGRQATASVNGTRVLAEMFIKNGHRVRTLSRLSPGINQRADVIVWIPDSFEPPDKKQREFLESWLAQGRGRTLIYVGRDYDAAGEYYQKIAPLLKPSEAVTFKRFEAEAKADYDSRRWEMPQDEYARWFTMRRDGTRHVAKKLQGQEDWVAGIDLAKADILIEGRLDPPVEADRKDKSADPPLPTGVTPLLWSDENGDNVYQPQEAIVTRITDSPTWGTGQVIVVTNGSFVLNYPLVNHEHRKLAGKLIEECAPGANVAFIESKNGEPTVLDKEPEAAEGAGLFDVARVWPLNAIVIHLTILGIIYCLAKADYDSRRWEMPKEQYARWFTARRDGTRHVAKKLQGQEEWVAGIDLAKAEILIEGRLDPPVEADRKDKSADPPLPTGVTPLLWSDENGDNVYQPQEAIVTRITDSPTWGTGQVIVVTNGSFVLNYPLVNHEHRKLAGKLIEECAPGANVAFIESKNGEPTVLDKEPEAAEGAGLFDVARVWPLNAIVIHLTILGIIYCLAKSPIFGRARELPSEASADFGKHVTALGQLMARSKDRAYAEQRIQQYQQQGTRKSGTSHLKGA